MPFSRDELDDAFRAYWRTGAVGEDWDAWADLFTEDAHYVEHVLGDLRGGDSGGAGPEWTRGGRCWEERPRAGTS